MRRSRVATTHDHPVPMPLVARQVNQFDKVLRENMEIILPGLIKKLFGIAALRSDELPDDIQHTKERKPDVLKKIVDSKGQTFVLHVEFQKTDEKEMAYRMAEYCIMLLRRYKLPVQQYVIYVGEGVPRRMKDHLHMGLFDFAYHIVALSSVDYHLLLEADKPEEKMLAILGDFGDSDPRQTIETIANGVASSSNSELARLRHIKQLHILSQLRNFEPENIDNMESAATWYKVEKDWFYIWGQKKGIEKGEKKKARELVESLLLKTDHSVREIASLVNVSESVVRRVKKRCCPK